MQQECDAYREAKAAGGLSHLLAARAGEARQRGTGIAEGETKCEHDTASPSRVNAAQAVAVPQWSLSRFHARQQRTQHREHTQTHTEAGIPHHTPPRPPAASSNCQPYLTAERLPTAARNPLAFAHTFQSSHYAAAARPFVCNTHTLHQQPLPSPLLLPAHHTALTPSSCAANRHSCTTVATSLSLPSILHSTASFSRHSSTLPATCEWLFASRCALARCWL